MAARENSGLESLVNIQEKQLCWWKDILLWEGMKIGNGAVESMNIQTLFHQHGIKNIDAKHSSTTNGRLTSCRE